MSSISHTRSHRLYFSIFLYSNEIFTAATNLNLLTVCLPHPRDVRFWTRSHEFSDHLMNCKNFQVCVFFIPFTHVLWSCMSLLSNVLVSKKYRYFDLWKFWIQIRKDWLLKKLFEYVEIRVTSRFGKVFHFTIISLTMSPKYYHILDIIALIVIILLISWLLFMIIFIRVITVTTTIIITPHLHSKALHQIHNYKVEY